MTEQIILNCPVNSLSLGQVSFNIIRELYKRKIQCIIFPKGPVDLGAYKVDEQFKQWLERSINNRFKKFDKNVPTFSIWHLNGSEFKPSDRQYLLTFHETDSPTEEEINIANQQNTTFFSSSWSLDNFKSYGGKNCEFLPLGFDEDFTQITKRHISNDITHWVLTGKFEGRKYSELIIKTWIKKYGGNKAHHLTLCVTNPFFKAEQMNAIYHNVFSGNKPFNVNVLPYLKTNVEMNQLYNSADIDLSGLSGGEAWGLPAFNCTALGKWSIVTNCSGHKDWANAENSIMVEPSGAREVYDGVFFAKGQPFSQGNIFVITEDQIMEAFGRAEKVAKTSNPEGRKLAEKFSYSKIVDQLLPKLV